jgi:hypothetical protein
MLCCGDLGELVGPSNARHSEVTVDNLVFNGRLLAVHLRRCESIPTSFPSSFGEEDVSTSDLSRDVLTRTK